MQIHELTNTADLSSTDYVGVDNGTTTRRFDLGALIASIRSRLTNAETGITNLQTSVSDVQDDVADAQSDITGLGTRLDAAESSITSQGTRLTTAEGDIDALEGRATTAESNITTLQNNKVDMTTPLLNFDDTAVDPTTDDGALANALTALGILSDVIPSGGGELYLKKALTKLYERVTTTRGEITMASGFTADIKYIKRQGDLVYLDFRLGTGEPTLNAWTMLGTIPEGFRPSIKIAPMGYDNDYSKPCAFRIDADGTLYVWRTSDNGPHTFLSTAYLV